MPEQGILSVVKAEAVKLVLSAMAAVLAAGFGLISKRYRDIRSDISDIEERIDAIEDDVDEIEKVIYGDDDNVLREGALKDLKVMKKKVKTLEREFDGED